MMRIRRMKKQVAAVALLFGMVFPAAGWAANVAVVDIQLIMQNSLAAQDVRAQLDDYREQFQKSIAADEEELRASEQELVKQRSVLSPEAFEQKRKEFQSQFGEVQREVQDKRIKLEKAHAQALAMIQKQVFEIIQSLSSEKGFEVAMPVSQLLYADQSLDITKPVLQKLDSALPKVPIDIDGE